MTTSRTQSSWRGIVLGLVAVLALAGHAYAQAEDEPTDEAFLATVAEARDATLARIDEAEAAIDAGCVGLAQEPCLTNHVAVHFPAIAGELEAYAAVLERLDAPETFVDDIDLQLAAVGDEIERLDRAVAAAQDADAARFAGLFQEELDAMTELVEQLDPAWARAAFLTALGSDVDILLFAGDLIAEERDYLAAARATNQVAAPNFACFSGAISLAYGGTDELLQALADCGAGSALPKVEAAGMELEPPERFADEHAWWLAGLAEQSRLDRRIGEAALEGDVASFLADNARLTLVFRPTMDMDPAFVRGYGGPGGASDPADQLASTAYGRGLFWALLDLQITNPFVRAIEAIQFPQVPREEALPALLDLAPELRSLDMELRDAIAELEPSPELAADHEVITDFLETYSEGLDALIDAAEAGDVDTTFVIQNAADAVYCETSASLSEAILTVADVFFDPDAGICR